MCTGRASDGVTDGTYARLRELALGPSSSHRTGFNHNRTYAVQFVVAQFIARLLVVHLLVNRLTYRFV